MITTNIYGGCPIKSIIENFLWYGSYGEEFCVITYIGDSILLFPDRSLDENLLLPPINKEKYWDALISLKGESVLLCDSFQITSDTLVSRILGIPIPNMNLYMMTKMESMKRLTRICLNDGNYILLFPLERKKSKIWIILDGYYIYEATEEAFRRFQAER